MKSKSNGLQVKGLEESLSLGRKKCEVRGTTATTPTTAIVLARKSRLTCSHKRPLVVHIVLADKITMALAPVGPEASLRECQAYIII